MFKTLKDLSFHVLVVNYKSIETEFVEYVAWLSFFGHWRRKQFKVVNFRNVGSLRKMEDCASSVAGKTKTKTIIRTSNL